MTVSSAARGLILVALIGVAAGCSSVRPRVAQELHREGRSTLLLDWNDDGLSDVVLVPGPEVKRVSLRLEELERPSWLLGWEARGHLYRLRFVEDQEGGSFWVWEVAPDGDPGARWNGFPLRKKPANWNHDNDPLEGGLDLVLEADGRYVHVPQLDLMRWRSADETLTWNPLATRKAAIASR